MLKRDIRKRYAQLRLALSDEVHQTLSGQICKRFFSSFDLIDSKEVHTYLPLESKKEPDTWLIIEGLRKNFPQVRINVPKVNKENLLDAYHLGHNSALEPGSFGIVEPVQGELVNPRQIDLAIIPLLAFDDRGNRLGYGKGHYDRFLKACRPDCTRVGLSFFEPVERIADVNEFDVPLHFCVTPEKLYRF